MVLPTGKNPFIIEYEVERVLIKKNCSSPHHTFPLRKKNLQFFLKTHNNFGKKIKSIILIILHKYFPTTLKKKIQWNILIMLA